MQNTGINGGGWPLQSPAFDPYKLMNNLVSTATQNTSEQSLKYLQSHYSNDGFCSEIKSLNGFNESSYVATDKFEMEYSN